MLDLTSIKVKKILILSFVSMFVINLFFNSVSSSNEEDSILLYFNAFPFVQIQYDYVNITCTVSNVSIIKKCELYILHPNNTESVHILEWLPEGIYVHKNIYNNIGRYSCYIIIETISQKFYTSPTRDFWITKSKNDIDNDGMPNWWEEQYNFNIYFKYDSNMDPDGDGFTNQIEYEHGTNPRINSIIQNASYRIRDNIRYLSLSIFFFLLIAFLSLYGRFHERSPL